MDINWQTLSVLLAGGGVGGTALYAIGKPIWRLMMANIGAKEGNELIAKKFSDAMRDVVEQQQKQNVFLNEQLKSGNEKIVELQTRISEIQQQHEEIKQKYNALLSTDIGKMTQRTTETEQELKKYKEKYTELEYEYHTLMKKFITATTQAGADFDINPVSSD
jgi:chromosome segregation ATPase